MSKRNLVICDCEHPYVDYLMGNILEKKEPSLRVFVCTSWESVCELMKSQSIQILLMDESYLYVPLEELDSIEKIVILTRQKEQKTIQQFQAVYKYQHIDKILSDIFEDIAIFRTSREDGQKVIAVYSPIHRCGKTSFAIALGQELAKTGKTLYLHLDTYASHMIFQREEGIPNLGDLLYYLRQEHTNSSLRLTAMVQQTERLDFLMPIPLGEDLKEVSPEEWMTFLQWLGKESPYERLVLDLGEGVQGLFQILERSNRIYMPVTEGEDSARKLSCYERNLMLMNMSGLEKKTVRVMQKENSSLDISSILSGGVA